MADGDELTTSILPDVVLGREPPKGTRLRGADSEALMFEFIQQGLSKARPNEDDLYNKIVNRVERELIAQVMLSVGNVQTKAASKLGINRNTLHKKLKEYGLEGEPASE
jgi:DNA-binding protein Fis